MGAVSADSAPVARAAAPEGPRRPDLARACAEFEALFLQQLFRQMRATVPRETPEGGSAGQIYGEMRDAEVARSLSRGRGIGLADVLYRQMVRRLDDGGRIPPVTGTNASNPSVPSRKELSAAGRAGMRKER